MLDAETIRSCSYAAMAILGGGALIETVRTFYKRHQSNIVVSALEKMIHDKKLTVSEAVNWAWSDEDVQWAFNYRKKTLRNYLNPKKAPKAWFK